MTGNPSGEGAGHDAPVLIVGGGVAGLACAIALNERGLRAEVFEAADEVGGRVWTDVVDGFALDRGFQVLLTAFPEVQRALDLDALELGYFGPGALVWRDGRLRPVVDPFRRPSSALGTLTSGVATIGDALRVARLRQRVCRGPRAESLESSGHSALDQLEREGFSRRIIDGFFRPFFGGVFLDRDLASTSTAFEYLMRMFAEGLAAIPRGGMAAIPRQLASRLPAGAVHTSARVAGIDVGGRSLTLEGGRSVEGAAVVVATESSVAAELTPGVTPTAMRATRCIEFDAAVAPPLGDLIALDGEGSGPINEVVVPSAVARDYAPEGRSLVTATAVGRWEELDDEALVAAARQQLQRWFGGIVAEWRLLRVDNVERAIPHQTPGGHAPAPRSPKLDEGLFVCGDHCDLASLQGALASGRRAGEAVAASLGAGAAH